MKLVCVVTKKISSCKSGSHYREYAKKIIIRITIIEKKFSIKDFFSKCDEIGSFLRIWPYIFEKILNGILHFCAMYYTIERVKRFKSFVLFYETTMNSK